MADDGFPHTIRVYPQLADDQPVLAIYCAKLGCGFVVDLAETMADAPSLTAYEAEHRKEPAAELDEIKRRVEALVAVGGVT